MRKHKFLIYQSAAQLSKNTGISLSTAKRFLKGSNIRINTAIKIMTALDITFRELLALRNQNLATTHEIRRKKQ